MKRNLPSIILVLISSLLILGGKNLSGADSPLVSANGLEDSKTQSSIDVDLSQFAWIAGHWKGEGMGGTFEETWNPPMAGSMMGMFKFVENEKIVFYEFLTIVPGKNSIVLRLKHFDPGLKGWETKDESVEFKLLSVSEDEIIFDGLKFKKLAENRMEIKVKMKERDDVKELVFKCERSKSKE